MNAFRPLLAAAVTLASLAFAQADVEETTTERVEMEVPGMPGMNMKVKVKTRTTTRTQVDEPPPAPPPGRPYYGRDCGTGDDPGCTMRRRLNLPMDAETYLGFIEALRGTDSEITRFDQVKDMLKTNWLTARQLGQVLDLFESEIYRLDVAKLAAPKVVNPKHALGFSTKFESSLYAADYTKVMSAQR